MSRSGEVVETVLSPLWSRLLVFAGVVTLGFWFGMHTPTAQPYLEHHDGWDVLGASSTTMAGMLLVPLLVVLGTRTVRYLLFALILALVFAYLSGWGLRFTITK